MMAQMRTGLRAYALDGHPPAGVMERLNQLALTLGAHQMTTLVLAVLDLEAERVRVVSAGHLPPVVRRPDGEAVLLDIDTDAPLGVSTTTTYREHEFELPDSASVVSPKIKRQASACTEHHRARIDHLGSFQLLDRFVRDHELGGEPERRPVPRGSGEDRLADPQPAAERLEVAFAETDAGTERVLGLDQEERR